MSKWKYKIRKAFKKSMTVKKGDPDLTFHDGIRNLFFDPSTPVPAQGVSTGQNSPSVPSIKSATTPPVPERHPARLFVKYVEEAQSQASEPKQRDANSEITHTPADSSAFLDPYIATSHVQFFGGLPSKADHRRADAYRYPFTSLLNTTIFEDARSECISVFSCSMASSRFSTFIDPASMRFSRLPENQIFMRREAKKQEAVIHRRLKRAGEPVPPYEFISYIGKGSYGRVYQCRDLQHDRRVAVKVIELDSQDYKLDPAFRDANLADLEKEYKTLKQLQGVQAENVNEVYEVRVVHSQIWIVTEYCPGGSVHTLMQGTSKKIEERYLRIIAREVAKGLRAVHKADIIHRDIKAANIMIHQEGAVQLIDFGVAGQLESAVDKRGTVIGTAHWMSPEILEVIGDTDPDIKYGKEVDTWSYGCTLIEMATGNPPNNRLPLQRLPKQIRLQGGPKLKAQDGYSEELCDLVAFVLEPDPTKRPSMDEILEHPYLRDTEEEAPTSSLSELVQVYDKWVYAGGQRASLIQPHGAEAAEFYDDPATKEQWRFSTIESTEMLEAMEHDEAFNGPYAGLSRTHIDPVADMTSAQAQEDSLNSYFADQNPDDILDQLPNTVYSPGPSPRPPFGASSIAISESVVPDEKSVQRGRHHLDSLFDQDKPGYSSPALTDTTSKSAKDDKSSDLPLRSRNASSTDMQRSDSEISSQGSLRSGKKIAKIDTLRANRYARPTTMDWDFPQAAPAAPDSVPDLPSLQPEVKNVAPPNTSDWAPNDDFGYGSPSEEVDESDYAPPPTRPPLRHAETEPVLVSQDLARGSRLDMDALLGDMGDTMPNYAFAAPPNPQNSLEDTDRVSMAEPGLDLDAMMSDHPSSLHDEPDPNTASHHSSTYTSSYEPTDMGETPATSFSSSVALAQPPSAEAMTEGATSPLLELELGRLAVEWAAGLEALGADFAAIAVEDSPAMPNGHEREVEAGAVGND